MRTTIYTLPVIEAFEAEDECPLCHLERKLEQEAISFILGAAYMADDIREQTDALGFCRQHFKMMYDYGNALGCAVLMQTYYEKLLPQLEEKISRHTPKKSSLLRKFKTIPDDLSSRSAQTDLGQWIDEKEKSCFVCSHYKKNYGRYVDTLLEMSVGDDDFQKKFETSKGFCLHHFRDLLEASEIKLSDKEKTLFQSILFELMENNMKRMQEDLNWFVDKHDYRNKDADWKNSRDAVQRGMQKLTGSYPADPPFRKFT